MNKDRASATALARQVAAALPQGFDADVLLFPPFPFLSDVVSAVCEAAHPIGVGAQNLHFEARGAFTGEVSAAMVLSTGASWALIGHSERRSIFGESDGLVRKKTGAALAAGLKPIVCVGETLAERRAGRTLEVVLGQLRRGLEGLSPAEAAHVTIAYEPVWAIGTGVNASPQEGQEVHRAIRAELAELAGRDVAAAARILYGGSVSASNVKALLSEPDIDGALVGGASLEADKFLPICHWKNS